MGVERMGIRTRMSASKKEGGVGLRVRVAQPLSQAMAGGKRPRHHRGRAKGLKRPGGS